MKANEHWEKIHQEKTADQVSWYQSEPTVSLAMIAKTGCDVDQPVIDIGGGISNLVDHLLAASYTNLAVLDWAASALAQTRQRLADKETLVRWIVGDVLTVELGGPYRIWHDRAVFHFLTEKEQQQRYLSRMADVVPAGGHAILSTFALDGPEKCSGLPVVRYSSDSLSELLGETWERQEACLYDHHTPWQSVQRFQASRFQKKA
jgi:SAM-dependent methyltransferase